MHISGTSSEGDGSGHPVITSLSFLLIAPNAINRLMVVIAKESSNSKVFIRGNINFPLYKYFPARNWKSMCRNRASVCTLMNAEPDPFPNLPSVMKRRGLPPQHCLVSQVNTHTHTHTHATPVTRRLDLPLNYSLSTKMPPKQAAV